VPAGAWREGGRLVVGLSRARGDDAGAEKDGEAGEAVDDDG
jgi:hypothetical protein